MSSAIAEVSPGDLHAADHSASGLGPRPKILYFAPKPCLPPDTGAKLRSYYLAREMTRYADVTCLAFSEPPDSRDRPSAAEPALASFECEPLFKRQVIVPLPPGTNTATLLRGALRETPLTVLRYTTREMARVLASLLDEGDFDLVHLVSIHLSAYLEIIKNSRSRPAVLCDWHNIESELMGRYSLHAAGIARRIYAGLTARSLRALERRVASRFDAHLAVSSRDRESILEYGSSAPVFVIENGVDLDRFPRALDQYLEFDQDSSQSMPLKRNRILFVGSMDYHANEDAAIHFARSIWPRVHSARPDLLFTVLGRRPSAKLRKLLSRPGIEITGTVDDVRPYYDQAIAAAVPLRIGGGSRLKILEAMAAGVPVVSTRLGAEGLDVDNGEDLLLADHDADFADAVLMLSRNRTARQALVRAGRALVEQRYGWRRLAARVQHVHETLLLGRSLAAGLPAHARLAAAG